MTDDNLSPEVQALKAISDVTTRLAGVVSTHTAALQVLLGLHMETLFILMSAKLLTAKQCLERLTRVRDGLAKQEELKPAIDLVEALIWIMRTLAERDDQSQAQNQEGQDAQAKLREILEKWPTDPTKH